MTGGTAPGAPASRNLRLALMASLALNILIIGAVAGSLLLPHMHGWKGRGHKPAGLAGFAETLPPERANLVRQKVQDARANLDALRKSEREAREEARKLLLEEPFDQAKFKAALDRAVEAGAKEKGARMSLVAETAAQLTPEERRQMRDWFEKHQPRYKRDRDEPKPTP